MHGRMWTFSFLLVTGLLATGLMFGVAQATEVVFNFSANGLDATETLTVSGNQAVGGTGTITGGALSGSETLTLVTLTTPAVHDLGGGVLSYRFGGGTDLIGDTYIAYDATPIVDDYGLVFLVSGPHDTGFNFWSDGATAYTGFLASNTLYAGYSGALTAYDPPPSAAPEPASLALLGASLFGLSLVRRKRVR